jgi:hypothetical protein
MPLPLPRWDRWVGSLMGRPIPTVSLLVNDGGLPRLRGGSAPTLNLSRPARHSLALRPVDSLHRRAAHLSRRLRRLCYLRRRSDSFRPERPSWPGGTCTRWVDTALSRRTRSHDHNDCVDYAGNLGCGIVRQRTNRRGIAAQLIMLGLGLPLQSVNGRSNLDDGRAPCERTDIAPRCTD